MLMACWTIFSLALRGKWQWDITADEWCVVVQCGKAQRTAGSSVRPCTLEYSSVERQASYIRTGVSDASDPTS
jgi:hypothetical protein